MDPTTQLSIITPLIAAVLLRCSDAGFSRAPSSQVVVVGDKAIFHCQHAATSIISWRVNGTSMVFNQAQKDTPESDYITTSRISLSDDPVHMLSITALPKFNQTRIECVAYLANGSPAEQSDPAILIIIDDPLQHPNNYYTNRVWIKVLIALLVLAMIVLSLAVIMRRKLRLFFGGSLVSPAHHVITDIERGLQLPLITSKSQVLDHSIIVIPHTTSKVGVLTANFDPSSISSAIPNMCMETEVTEPIKNQENDRYSSNQPNVEYSPQEETIPEETIQECQEIIYKPTKTGTEVFDSTCAYPHVVFPSAVSSAIPVPSPLYYLKCPSLAAHEGQSLNIRSLFMGHKHKQCGQLPYSTSSSAVTGYSLFHDRMRHSEHQLSELESDPWAHKCDQHELSRRQYVGPDYEPELKKSVAKNVEDETDCDSLLDFHSNAEELFKIACDCQNTDNEKHLLICGQNTITTIGVFKEERFKVSHDCSSDDVGDFISGKDPILVKQPIASSYTVENFIPRMSEARQCLVDHSTILQFPYNVEPDQWLIPNNTIGFGT